MDQKNNNSDDEATSLVKGGIAAVMGGGLALCQPFTGDAVAVFGLGIANAVMPNVIDFGARWLSLNERRRVYDVEYFTYHEIQRYLQEGHSPRTDGFLSLNPGVRSSGQELCEGVLELARTEYQEAKLPHMGYLYASILFEETISPNEANRLLRILNDLTYREMCILGALYQEPKHKGLRENCLSLEGGSEELTSLMQECSKLEGQSLLSQTDNDQGPHYGNSTWAHMVPSKIRFTEYGTKLAKLAKLSEVPEVYTGPIREALSR
jgi:hypothetical protein